MQVQNHENFEERMLYYWSKLYSKSLNKFEEYNENKKQEKNIYKYLKKTISIQFLDFEPENLKSLQKFHSEWKILETECSNIVLTDHFEFHIISLEKLRKMIQKGSTSLKNSGLVDWGKFLINPYNLDKSIFERNEAIKMAKQKLDEFNSKEYEVRIAELRHKAILDKNNMEYTGYVRGEKKTRIEIAKELLKINLPIDEIIRITKLTEKEIDDLK